jgi:hypothetical protein
MFSVFIQSLQILPAMAKRNSSMSWPIFYLMSFIYMAYLKATKIKGGADVACFGWHCVAIKSSSTAGV